MAKYKGIDSELAKAAGLIDPAQSRRSKNPTYAEQMISKAEDQIRLQKLRDQNLEAYVRQQTMLGLPLPPAMSDEQVEVVEKKIGRKVSDAEKAMGMLGREDAPDLNNVFRPVVKESKAGLYDADIAEAEAAVEAERVSKMSEAQRTLYAMQQAKADHVKKTQSAAALASYLEKHKDRIEWLHKVREGAALNPQWSNEQLATLDSAIAQYQVGPDGDEDAADNLHGEVTVIMFRHIQEQKEDVANKLRAAGVLSESEIEAAVAKRFPEQKQVESEAEDALPEWHALHATSMELFGVYDKLKKDTNAKPADVEAAKQSWMKQSQTTTAKRKEWEAAKAAEADSAGNAAGATTEGAA